MPYWPQNIGRKPRETVVTSRPRERLSITANCSAACIGCTSVATNVNVAEHHAVGLAREQREQLLGAGKRGRGHRVAVRRVHGVKARALGEDALLDHRVEAVGDLGGRQRPAVGAREVRVDEVADAHQ